MRLPGAMERKRKLSFTVKQGVPAQMRFVSWARHGSPFQALSYARGLLCAPLKVGQPCWGAHSLEPASSLLPALVS